MKDLYWYPASKSDLDNFFDATRRFFGYQLHLLQSGETPDDIKALSGLGKGLTGVYELRYRDEDNIYRVAYVAKIKNAIVVLHRWQKKTRKTAQSDLKLIAQRFREVREELI